MRLTRCAASWRSPMIPFIIGAAAASGLGAGWWAQPRPLKAAKATS
ncbi:hypothetical protein JCM19239_5811 [Vibrio variabilis]|uniref:Uncharacterized protein n=1 Tax=Vibrio variabilis TaxID=990271 RepID=A0ABQ0J880_9VIBR|nr:hypothetical protein JCM19239_5811 [Vibrio variabilis]